MLGLVYKTFRIIDEKLSIMSLYFIYTLQENTIVSTIDSYEDVTPYNEKALQKAVANQPVTIAMEGSGSAFQFYESVKCYLFCTFIYMYMYNIFV